MQCRWRFTPAALPSPLTFSPSSSLQLSDQHSPVPSRAAGVGSQGTVPSWAVSGSTPYLKPGPAGQGTPRDHLLTPSGLSSGVLEEEACGAECGQGNTAGPLRPVSQLLAGCW